MKEGTREYEIETVHGWKRTGKRRNRGRERETSCLN